MVGEQKKKKNGSLYRLEKYTRSTHSEVLFPKQRKLTGIKISLYLPSGYLLMHN